MPDFFAWDPADWSALAAAITTVIAMVAAVFALLQVRQARLLREEQAQPFVIVDFEPSPAWGNIIDLVIENSGKTIAKDVRVVFDPPLVSSQREDGYELAKSVLLTQGIPTMPPGKRITTMFDLSHERKDSGLPMSYTATVSFADWRNKRQKPLTYVLDLNFLYGLTQATEYGMHDAAKALREIRDTMKKWTAHFNGLRVHVVDEDARNFSDRWQREKSGKNPSLASPVPAGRRTPSHFDRYREPIWRRIYWSIRLEEDRRGRIQELEAQRAARPDLAPMLADELDRLRSSGWRSFGRKSRR